MTSTVLSSLGSSSRSVSNSSTSSSNSSTICSNLSTISSNSSCSPVNIFTIPAGIDSLSYLNHLFQINVLEKPDASICYEPDLSFKVKLAVTYKDNKIIGRGIGGSKQKAKQAAAAELLLQLQSFFNKGYVNDEACSDDDRVYIPLSCPKKPVVTLAKHQPVFRYIDVLRRFAQLRGVGSLSVANACLDVRLHRDKGTVDIVEFAIVWTGSGNAWMQGQERLNNIKSCYHAVPGYRKLGDGRPSQYTIKGRPRKQDNNSYPVFTSENPTLVEVGDIATVLATSLRNSLGHHDAILLNCDEEHMREIGVDVSTLLPQAEVTNVYHSDKTEDEGCLTEWGCALSKMRKILPTYQVRLPAVDNTVQGAYVGLEFCMARMAVEDETRYLVERYEGNL